MGPLTEVSTQSVILKTTKHSVVIVAVAADTKFMKENTEVKIADVSVGHRVAVEAKKDAKDTTKLVAHMAMIDQMGGHVASRPTQLISDPSMTGICRLVDGRAT